jgi:putative ABC transport system substrate-binding protein
LNAVKQATSTTPIVMVGFTDDPVEEGWIDSYRRPGTNVTGIFNVNANLVAKRLEILKEVIPELSRVAVFYDPVFGRRQLDTMKSASKVLGVELEVFEVANGEDLPVVFRRAKRRKVGAVTLLWSPVFYVHRQEVAQLSLDFGLPLMADQDYLVSAGCLVFYGAMAEPAFVRAGYFVDRLLKGVKPDQLPVEQLSDIKLVVNLKSARALGITIPESIFLRADEVIE